MQELEKILEEIENTFKENIENIEDENGVHHFVIDSFTATFLAKDIIRKHMNDVPEKEDAEICLSKEDFEFLRNHESMTFRCGNEYVTLHKGRRDGEKEMQRDNDSWIPVEERLPEECDSMFATLKGTDKWSKGMFEKISDDVNVTVEYEDGTRKTISAHTLDGQWKLPSRILKQKVIAWCPYPEPYKKIQEENK